MPLIIKKKPDQGPKIIDLDEVMMAPQEQAQPPRNTAHLGPLKPPDVPHDRMDDNGMPFFLVRKNWVAA